MSCRSSPATHTLGSTRRSVWFSSVSLSGPGDRKSTRLNSSHANISYAVFCLKKNIEVVLKHGTSRDIVSGVRSGALAAGFYNEPAEPELDLATLDVGQIATHVVAAPGSVSAA